MSTAMYSPKPKPTNKKFYLRFLGEGQLLLSPRPGPVLPPGPPLPPPLPPPLLPVLPPGPGRRFCLSMPGR